MFSTFATKIAMKKMGMSKKDLDISSAFSSPTPEPPKRSASSRFGRRPTQEQLDAADAQQQKKEEQQAGWPSWLTIKALPLTVQPWMTPAPPPVEVALTIPKIGDRAPQDQTGQLVFGGGKRVLVVFLRCVGCAFAQKAFLALRTLATRYGSALTCVAVSHSSAAATAKWVDMLGGAWNVQVVVDEERAIYAAWGLGVASVWHMFNPTTQMQSWRETGWLGEKVAGAITMRAGSTALQRADANRNAAAPGSPPTGGPVDLLNDPASGVLGNKWQESGAFAVDGSGRVVWGRKVARADEVLDMDAAAKTLGF